jgi:type I restriction enzyme S subunit
MKGHDLEVPSGWRKAPLGEQVTLEYGASLPVENRRDGNVVVLGSSGVIGRHNKALQQGPGIVVGRKGTVGSLTWVNGPYWPIDTTYFVKPLVEARLPWLFRALSLVGLDRLDSSTGVPGLNRNDAYPIPVLVPDLAEQARIAEVLDTLDEAIQKVTLITEKLLTMKSALLHSVFMEEPRLLRGGKGTHQGNLVRLGSICKTMSGGTPSRSVPTFWNGDVPWVKTGEINYLDILSTEECITSEGLKSSPARLFPSGTVLMAMYGEGVTRGKVAILAIEAATNQACLAFFPNQQLRARYLYWWLCSAYELLRSISADGSQKNLSSKIIEGMQVPLPSTEEQEKVAAIFDSIDSHLRQEQSVRDALVAIKSGLSADLLSGRVRTTPR